MSLRGIARMQRSCREIRPTLTLAVPIMAGMVSHMLIGLADTIMVGHVGVVPLAASAFVNAVTHVPLVFAIGMVSAISILTAQTFGAGRSREAGEVLRHGLVIAGVTGVVAALLLAGLRPHLNRFGQPPEVVAAAGTYLLLFGCSVAPAIMAHACKQFSEALNHPWIPNFILLGAVGLNIFLNWILIYGNWGAPAMGLEGAGLATLLARTIMMLVMVAYVLKAKFLQPFQPVKWWSGLDKETFSKLFRIGWPVGLQHFLEVSAFVFAALMMGWLSAEAIAAHQIAITCASTTFMFALGIAMGTSIRVGHAYGAGKRIAMRRIGFVGVGLAALVMAFFALMFMTAGKPISRLFVDSPAVVLLATQMLFVAGLFQIADGIQIAAMSALRGMGDVRVPAWIALMAYWIVAIPFGYLLAFPGQFGASGIWIGLAVGLFVAAMALLWRFHLKTKQAPFHSKLKIKN